MYIITQKTQPKRFVDAYDFGDLLTFFCYIYFAIIFMTILGGKKYGFDNNMEDFAVMVLSIIWMVLHGVWLYLVSMQLKRVEKVIRKPLERQGSGQDGLKLLQKEGFSKYGTQNEPYYALGMLPGIEDPDTEVPVCCSKRRNTNAESEKKILDNLSQDDVKVKVLGQTDAR